MNFSLQLNIIHEKLIIAKSLCLLLLMFILFSLFTSYFEFKSIYSDTAINTISSANLLDNKTSQETIKKSLNIDLFGKYISNQLGDVNIRPSILDLTIIGIMFSEDKNNSQVLLRFANGVERIFKIGDTIPGGAKILHISAEGIVVSRDGNLESLNLPKDELIFEKQPEILNKNDID